MKKTILITGGCGFIGTNAAAYYLKRGYKVFSFDNLSRAGAKENLNWLKKSQTLKFMVTFGAVHCLFIEMPCFCFLTLIAA